MYDTAEQLYFQLAHENLDSHVMWIPSGPRIMKIDIQEVNTNHETAKHLEYIWQKNQWILAQQL